ncbi:MAG TPA: glycine betaine ABC transporter substrate-binding protein, partial [Prochlorococcus sp.]
HKKYWAKVSTRVLDLGPMYSGRVGWVVPDYVPKASVGSMSDLTNPNVASVFKGTVQGIDPGSGLMQSSKEALNIYELTKIKLVSASDAAMTAVLDQAIRDKQWVVVTGWTPHWMFARYQLRFLKDPKGVFGGQEGIHAIARLGLDKDHPKVVAFLTRFKLSDSQLDAMLLDAQNTSTEQAVNNYIANNRKQIDYWMNGNIQESKDGKAKP